MARKPIDKRKLPAAIVAARESAHPTAIALQGGDARRRFTDTMVATVLLKVATGMSVKQCAEEFGISPATIYQRRYDDPEGFGNALEEAYRARTHVLKDTVIEVAYDKTLSASDKKVIIEALQWTAKVDNRGRYGDKLQVDQRQVVINIPPELDGI